MKLKLPMTLTLAEFMHRFACLRLESYYGHDRKNKEGWLCMRITEKIWPEHPKDEDDYEIDYDDDMYVYLVFDNVSSARSNRYKNIDGSDTLWGYHFEEKTGTLVLECESDKLADMLVTCPDDIREELWPDAPDTSRYTIRFKGCTDTLRLEEAK